MTTEFGDLTRRVLHEIDTFVIPEPHPRQLGVPLPPEWFIQRLAEMRAALVDPYRLTVLDEWTCPDQITSREVVVVADDGIAVVAHDPNPEGDFVIVWRRPGDLALSNMRGSAVDCFLTI
jgi:hypothetical protein